MIIIGGPCLLANDIERMTQIAKDLRDAGNDVFRAKVWGGGTFPPSATSALWGVRDVNWMAEIGKRAKVNTCTETRTAKQSEAAAQSCWGIWTAARAMQVYDFIRFTAKRCMMTGSVMMVKRGPGNTIREVAGIMQHIDQVGYPIANLWVIDRGVAGIGYDPEVRWRPDILSVLQIKELDSRVKVMVDVSHSVGRREYVVPMALAAKAIGADGIMVEVYDKPEESLSDARQAIDINTFETLVKGVKA